MSEIEWTDKTWNPTTGCDRISSGCDACYALVMAKRLKSMGNPKYQHDGDPRTSGPGFGLTVHPDTLDLPLRWRKPRRVFVNSMSDLFHDKVPDEFIAQVWAVMAMTKQHTYQILTKRHGRMRALLNSSAFADTVIDVVADHPLLDRRRKQDRYPLCEWDGTLPLPNVWMGVSVEDQKRADLRIPALLETPAAVRFISCEPLLGNVSLWRWLSNPSAPHHLAGRPLPHLSWVIIGGESGPGARSCDPEWIRALVTQCRAAGVSAFVKQLGSHWAHANGWTGKGGLPEQWPADLRVREFPG